MTYLDAGTAERMLEECGRIIPGAPYAPSTQRIVDECAYGARTALASLAPRLAATAARVRNLSSIVEPTDRPREEQAIIEDLMALLPHARHVGHLLDAYARADWKRGPSMDQVVLDGLEPLGEMEDSADLVKSAREAYVKLVGELTETLFRHIHV